MSSPFTYVKEINDGKDLTKTLDNDFTDYSQFLINKAFSFHIDTVMYANEMNTHKYLSDKQHYQYYINTVRPKKRYGWIKDEKSEDLNLIQEIYQCNRVRARSILKVLNEEQLNYLRKIKLGT